MSRVLLLGATTALGRQLLLKLALAGHEVVAQLTPGCPTSDVGDFASQVLERTPAQAVVESGCMTIVAAAPLDEHSFDGVREVLAASHRIAHGGGSAVDSVGASMTAVATVQHWVQCAPFIRRLEWRDARQRVALEELGVRVSLVRHAPLFAEVAMVFGERRVVGRWGVEMVNPVHEGEVASIALRALAWPGVEEHVGGPEVLNWRAIARKIAAARGRRAWIVPWPRWMVRAPEPYLAPSRGMRTLDDYLHAGERQRLQYACDVPPTSPRARRVRRGAFA